MAQQIVPKTIIEILDSVDSTLSTRRNFLDCLKHDFSAIKYILFSDTFVFHEQLLIEAKQNQRNAFFNDFFIFVSDFFHNQNSILEEKYVDLILAIKKSLFLEYLDVFFSEEDLIKMFSLKHYYSYILYLILSNMCKDKFFRELYAKNQDDLRRLNHFFCSVSLVDKDLKKSHIEELSYSDFLKNLKTLNSLYLETKNGKKKMKGMYEKIRQIYPVPHTEFFNKVATGQKNIDSLLEGGLEKNKNTLFLSSHNFILQKTITSMCGHALEHNEHVVVISSENSFRDFKERLLKHTRRLSNLIYVDLFSSAEKEVQQISFEKNVFLSPMHFGLIQGVITDAILSFPRFVHKLVVIDTTTLLFRKFEKDIVFDYLFSLIDGLHRNNCTPIVLLDIDAFPHIDFKHLVSQFDNTIKVVGRGKETQFFLERIYGGTPEKKVIEPFG